jgi:hypothetical protein
VSFTLNGVGVGNGAAEAGFTARSVDSSPLAAGGYIYKAIVGSNDNYIGATSADEPLTVNKAVTTTDASVQTTSPQYSDEVRLRAVVTPYEVPSSAPAFQLTGTVYFYIGSVAVPCTVLPPAGWVGSDSIADADNGVAEVDVQILNAQGSYTVTACFYGDANFANSSDTTAPPSPEGLTVNREDATVTPGAGNLNAYPVSGTTTNFTLTFTVKETTPEPDENAGALPGEIGNAGLTVNLNAVGSGANNKSVVCTSTYSATPPVQYADTKVFTCSFASVAIDAYEVQALVTGNYYVGQFIDALTVYDPSAGFVTGGGKLIYPDGSSDRVNFGLVFNFTGKGKTTPRGNLLVMRHLANGDVCRIKSNAIDAPAVVGKTASYSGKGNYGCTRPNGTTYDGIGNMSILGWLEDNGEPGSSSSLVPDRFWVNMTVPNSKLVMPAPATTYAQPLTGGNIQVPQPSSR